MAKVVNLHAILIASAIAFVGGFIAGGGVSGDAWQDGYATGFQQHSKGLDSTSYEYGYQDGRQMTERDAGRASKIANLP